MHMASRKRIVKVIIISSMYIIIYRTIRICARRDLIIQRAIHKENDKKQYVSSVILRLSYYQCNLQLKFTVKNLVYRESMNVLPRFRANRKLALELHLKGKIICKGQAIRMCNCMITDRTARITRRCINIKKRTYKPSVFAPTNRDCGCDEYALEQVGDCIACHASFNYSPRSYLLRTEKC